MTLSVQDCLPRSAGEAVLGGRAWLPSEEGPAVIGGRGDEAVDLTRSHPTVEDARPGTSGTGALIANRARRGVLRG